MPALIELVDVVKLDVQALGHDGMTDHAARLKRHGVRLLAGQPGQGLGDGGGRPGLGAEDDAVALHRALDLAGKPSALSAAQTATLGDMPGDGLSGAHAVVRARSALSRYL